MKRLVFGLTLVLLINSCINKSEQQAKSAGEEIWFAETTFDYGEIPEGSDGLYNIEFKNIGDEAIVINKVRTSCGCTVPSWPKKPIEPGETGEIEVKYNTGLIGAFMKSVTVYSSAENSPVKLTIRGKVVPVEKSQPGTDKQTNMLQDHKKE